MVKKGPQGSEPFFSRQTYIIGWTCGGAPVSTDAKMQEMHTEVPRSS